MCSPTTKAQAEMDASIWKPGAVMARFDNNPCCQSAVISLSGYVAVTLANHAPLSTTTIERDFDVAFKMTKAKVAGSTSIEGDPAMIK
jgi:hypothetical protein